MYLTCNTLPHNDEIVHLEQFVNDALAAGVDAMIANDIGVFSLIKNMHLIWRSMFPHRLV